MIERIKVTRETMIKELSFSMFDTMENNAEYRLEICRYGHPGFEYMNDNELLKEYRSLIIDDPEDDTIIEMESKL